MILDFDFCIKNKKGDFIKDGTEKVNAAEVLSSALENCSPGIDPAKACLWAQKLYSEKKLDLDSEDATKLESYIKYLCDPTLPNKTVFMPTITAGALLDTIRKGMSPPT